MSESDGISLKDYIERILDEREAKLQLTAKMLDVRLNALNELHNMVMKDRETYLCRAVYDEMHNALIHRVEVAERFQSRMVGIGIVLVVVSGILGSVLGHLWK